MARYGRYWALTHGTGHVSPNRKFGEWCWPPNFVYNLTHMECFWDSAVGIRSCFSVKFFPLRSFAQDAGSVGGQAGDPEMVSLALCPRSLKSVYLLA